jgi:NADH-quinone oxidoreductase subunit L
MTAEFRPLGLILLFPLVGVLFNLFFGRRAGRQVVNTVATGVIFIAFGFAVWALARLLTMPAGASLHFMLWPWIIAGSFHTAIALRFDALSAVMTLIVSGVGALVHLYSIGYMDHDKDYARYFTYLNLFLFSMLVLVLADNLLLMFVGWEGVGLCSYLLIAFWYDNQQYAYNGREAFIVNRVGDAGFILGILTIVGALSKHGVWSLNFATMQAHAAYLAPVATTACLLLLLGATGKSAQIPLYVWLPDAMVGPTPVSSLIHAATMVTAGVYMIARLHFLYMLSPTAMYVVAAIGACTCFYAATLAIVQSDIKRVLAYSTISQLGYMFLGVGVGAFAAGIFHLMTHAFFKGLLFLCSGSIIHVLEEQDMNRLGGLWRKMPITYATMLAAAFAISAFPGFSGYFSKDLILERAYAANDEALWLLGLITAALTAFYIFRLIFLTFHGESHLPPDKEVHEARPVMCVAMITLGLLAVFGGWVEMPNGWLYGDMFTHFLDSVVGPFRLGVRPVPPMVDGASVAAMAVGIAAAWVLYIWMPALPGKIAETFNAFYQFMLRKYYVDDLYRLIFARFLFWSSTNVLSRGVDRTVIDGIIDGTGLSVETSGDAVRRSQTGNLQVYAFVYLLGAVGIVAYYIYLVMAH